MNSNITVLYVDDEPMNLRVFELNFKGKYNIITATSGEGGLQKLNVNKDISVVISDMKMPGMNGLEFVEEARKNYPDIAYFILTGFDISPEIYRALENNLIHKYFNKPFSSKEISSAIEEAIIRS